MHGIIKVKWKLGTQDMIVWTGYKCLRIDTSGDTLERGNKPFSFI